MVDDVIRITNDKDYGKLRTTLLSAVRKRCPAWLSEDAEDIAQNALIKLHQKLERSPDMHVNKAYVHKVAYSVLLDEIRYRQRRFEGNQNDAMHEDYEVVDRQRIATQLSLGDALQDCLAQQQDRRRRALTLHLLGHTTSEVAQFMGVKVKQAENLVYRGLATLRDCLIKKEAYP